MRLGGKVALITGAAAGIGRAAAVRFAREGAAVVVADIDEAGAKDTSAVIEDAGGSAMPVHVDVTSLESTLAMAAAAVERFARIDVLYANAGIGGTGTAAEVEPDIWDLVVRTNLTGVWLSSRAVLPSMMAARGGSIIAQASVVGLVGFRRTAAYSASKGGVIALARQMAVDYAEYGIRVNTICPGVVPTQLLTAGEVPAEEEAGVEEQVLRRYARRLPLARLGTVDDIANLALFLASDEAAWVTGTVYSVDGGTSAV